MADIKLIILCTVLVLPIFAIFARTLDYHLTKNLIVDLLRINGPMTGLELVNLKIPRGKVYLILYRLENAGVVESFIDNSSPKYEGQIGYRLKESIEDEK